MSVLDTLAKVDLHCHFDGALTPEQLARLATDRGLPEGGDLAAVSARLRCTDAASLDSARAWVRSLLASSTDLSDAAADLARRLMAEAIVHVELHVDVLGYGHTGLSPAEVLTAIDQGLTAAVVERDDAFLSWVLVAEVRRSAEPDAALAAVQSALGAGLERMGGVAIAGDDEARLAATPLKAVLEAAREAGVGRVIAANGRERVAEALELGAQRVVGAAGALQDPGVVLQLRAHRLPVVVCPTWQVLTGAVRSLPQHPIRKMQDAGLFLAIGSGHPTLLGTTLTGELAALSKHHHYRLDDIRNATTRAIEAAFMHPHLRFQLARTVEIWRHRPHAAPAAKGDNWSV